MLAKAIAMKPSVIAPEIPVIDQPVSRAIARRNTGSENIAPIAMQPIRPPAATITQRYRESGIWRPLSRFRNPRNRAPAALRGGRSSCRIDAVASPVDIDTTGDDREIDMCGAHAGEFF